MPYRVELIVLHYYHLRVRVRSSGFSPNVIWLALNSIKQTKHMRSSTHWAACETCQYKTFILVLSDLVETGKMCSLQVAAIQICE